MTKVLLVDDEESVRRLESRLLANTGYECSVAPDVRHAQDQMEREHFDLALVDVNMPGASGLELVRYAASQHPETATVMVTGVDDCGIANAALELGAYGYVLKPFGPNELLINVNNALRRRDLEVENRAHRDRLENLVQTRTSELDEALARLRESEEGLRSSREETVIRLARAAESRDQDTGHHIQRMSRYCALLAHRIGIDDDRCEQIRLASILHDVGKIGIPDQILLKPGRLTPEERKLMQRHVELGYRMLRDSESELLQLAATIALTHHEKFDGSGYSRGLAGEAIPLEGRIAAIADVFDALSSDRVYRDAMAVETVVGRLRAGRGTHFDPLLLETFLDGFDEVLAIKTRYADGSTFSS